MVPPNAYGEPPVDSTKA